MNKVQAFFKAPLNQAALVTVLGTSLAVAQGTMSWHAAVPVMVSAIVALIIPDNTLAKDDIEQLVADAIKAAGALKETK